MAQQIEHDPDEPPREKGANPWPLAFLMGCVFTAMLWASSGIDWPSMLMGALLAFTASFWFVGFMRYKLFKSWNGTGGNGRSSRD
jgi:hypothetical protein